MTNKDTGGPAFPQPYQTCQSHMEGMTLRDYFAAKAMLMAFGDIDVNKIAAYCYEMADAMLEARQ